MISIEFKWDSTNGCRNCGKCFEFYPGQVVGVFGDNGSGKTTFLKQLMGIAPYAKQLSRHMIDGKRFSRKSLKDMAYITGGYCLYDDMTATEHAKYYAKFFKRFDKKKFETYIDMFEIDSKMQVKDYSRGQRAKLEMILGLCKGAKYMLLDEPFLGMDPFSRADFIKLLAGMQNEDTIIIISTHYIEEIENFIDRVLIMRYREVMKDTTMEKLKRGKRDFSDIMRQIYNIDKQRVIDLFLEEEQ